MDAIEIETGPNPAATVIWLHGLGADGHDFVPVVPELHLPESPPVRFVFPHAPVRPVTINNNMAMRAWYDIYSLGGMRRQDEAGVRDSERILQGYVQRERAAGIAADRIVLAGFSQGGAIALHAGLRHPEKLAGILALSTYLPLSEQLAECNPARKDTPILMCHGTEDPMLPVELGMASRDLLQQAGYTVEWREYPMPHSVSAAEIVDVAAWLRQRLPDDGPRIILPPHFRR